MALLRFAPWVDLVKLRAQVVKRIRQVYTYDSWKKAISRYESGEAPTLPNTYGVMDIVGEVARILYNQHESDPRYFDGIDAMKLYFTDAAYWEEIS